MGSKGQLPLDFFESVGFAMPPIECVLVDIFNHIIFIQKCWYILAFIHVNPHHITNDKFRKPLSVHENPRQKWRLAVYFINNHVLLKNPVLCEARHAILLKV